MSSFFVTIKEIVVKPVHIATIHNANVKENKYYSGRTDLPTSICYKTLAHNFVITQFFLKSDHKNMS